MQCADQGPDRCLTLWCRKNGLQEACCGDVGESSSELPQLATLTSPRCFCAARSDCVPTLQEAESTTPTVDGFPHENHSCGYV